jgi:predicted HicB family RNase H-like nuclease
MADYILRYDDALHKRVKIRAAEEGITVKEVIIKAIEQYLKTAEKKGGKG